MSPVVSGDDLWLTTATETGKNLRAIRVDCRTGEIVFRSKPLFEVERSEKISPKNSHATPTPVLDGDRLAWLYVLNAFEGGLPSARYLGIMADAAEAAGAPDDYVRDLRTRECRNIGP